MFVACEDFICNYVGGDMWTSDLTWPGKTAFNESPFKNWTVQGRVAGYAKAAQGLTFLEVANAGHLAPMVHLMTILSCIRFMLAGRGC
jgi:carboxypeptidase C (cathepsin A)